MTATPAEAISELHRHRQQENQTLFKMSALFAARPQRAKDCSLQLGGLLLDYSKNIANDTTWKLLEKLADAAQIETKIAGMFRGEKINTTEDRAAAHYLLREQESSRANAEVVACLNRIEALVEAIHSKQWLGYTGKPITQVVNIGIGGSDLGPAMAVSALEDYRVSGISSFFVANIDPQAIESALAQVDPEQALFIVASKSFTTLETRQNANRAREWFLQQGGSEESIRQHFVAISSNVAKAEEFGIAPENIFPMWDWVGGRYSLWSAIGLSVALAVGMRNFRELLAGGYAMDRHFAEAPALSNMPVILALLHSWYALEWGARAQAVIPYSERLSLLPDFLQQLCMESLGKSVDFEGRRVSHPTGEIVFGSVGSNSQHSFFQLLHQGTHFIPVDFIAVVNSTAGTSAEGAEAQQQLLANCLGQSKALMEGRDEERQGTDSGQQGLAAHRSCPGNRPSNTLLLDTLSPLNLGKLIALYEHKVFVQSLLFDINAFDQWGVEIGKKLAVELNEAFDDPQRQGQLDGSSRSLISTIHEWRYREGE